jgi:hypothetical protein
VFRPIDGDVRPIIVIEFTDTTTLKRYEKGMDNYILYTRP